MIYEIGDQVLFLHHQESSGEKIWHPGIIAGKDICCYDVQNGSMYYTRVFEHIKKIDKNDPDLLAFLLEI